MNILSLFDGISCGRVALERANIPVDRYYASEIEQSAMSISAHHYPSIIKIGSVTDIEYHDGVLHTAEGVFDVGPIDLLMGGSPCTDFSSIGYIKGMKSGTTEILSLAQYLELKRSGAAFEGQSYLFWEYVRLLHEVKPRYFLLENVVMPKKWRQVINDAMGLSPIAINSALLSAQNRPRLYWTNINGVEAPSDKHIMLDDILDDAASKNDVSKCQTVSKSFRKFVDKYGYIPEKFNAYNIKEIKDKACALSRGSMVTSSCASLVFVPCEGGVHHIEDGIMDGVYPVKLEDGTYNIRKLSIREMERLQTLPDDYTLVENVGVQKRSAAIGNGWTVDVIAHILSFLPKEEN